MQFLLGVFVVICIMVLLGTITRSKIIHFLTRGCIGGIMIVVMNCLLPHCVVGVSLYTIGFTALLGMPGLMTLYVLQMLI